MADRNVHPEMLEDLDPSSGRPRVYDLPWYTILVHAPDVGAQGFTRYQTELNTLRLTKDDAVQIDHDDVWHHFQGFDEETGRYIPKAPAGGT